MKNKFFEGTAAEIKKPESYAADFAAYSKSLRAFIGLNFPENIPPELLSFMDPEIDRISPDHFNIDETVDRIMIAENFIRKSGVDPERPDKIKKFFREKWTDGQK